jgi:gliding motility-associated-like protein
MYRCCFVHPTTENPRSKNRIHTTILPSITDFRYMKHCITILSILLCGWLRGQNCPLEAPYPSIPANDSIIHNFDVFDVISNNLAAPGQGVCGVQMRFRHNSITDFEVWLISPAGTQVQLIGPNATVSPATLGGSWNVTFVKCLGTTPMPQVPYQPRWNNSTNPFGATGITGSYWPYSGCLEEFNNGPVNGTWKLKLKTLSNTQIRGSLLALDIQFCDKRGQKCCFADAGALTGPNTVAACQADSDLKITTAPTYSGVKPDSTKYAYKYAIGRDMVLMGYTNTPDLRRMPAGNYQVCGLSFLRKDTSLFPAPNNVLRLDTLRNRLRGDSPPFCGELTNNCISVAISPRPDSTVLPLKTICEGDSIVISDQVIKQSGRYPVTFNQPGRCDSLVIVNVLVQKVLRINLADTICSGDSLVVGTKRYKTSGFYTDTLKTRSGCDSIVSLNLRVLPPIPVKDTTIEICSGRSVVVGGQRFSAMGTYTIPLVSSNGCDSLIRLTLSVIEPQSIITATDTVLTCTRNQVVLDGTKSLPSGKIIYRWEDNMGNPIGDSTHFVVKKADTYYLQVISAKSLCARRSRIIIQADTSRPIINIGGLDTLDCNTPRITLNASNSSNLGNPTYAWTTRGNGRIEGVVNQPIITLSGPGDYTLNITNNRNGCSATGIAQIQKDTLVPLAKASATDTLTCTTKSIDLSGIGSSQGPAFRYLWRSLTGQAVTNPTALQASTQNPGLYQLAVTNAVNHCVGLDTVQVVADTTLLRVAIDPSRNLDCATRSIVLTGRPSSTINSVRYSWTASNGGNITSATNLPTITVNQAGRYLLEITDQINGCSSNAEVTVKDSSNVVRAVIATPASLSCKQPQTTLNGAGSQGGNSLVFKWKTSDGRIIGASNQMSITVASGGTYQLIVRDSITQCSDSASVLVNANINLPIANAGLAQELSCSKPSVTLSGQGSASGNIIRYLWKGPCPIADSSALNIQVNCEGTYILQVIDTLRGCIGTDTVLVSRNPLSPNAQVAANTASINCTAGEAVLSARGSSGGQIHWFFQNIEIGIDTQVQIRAAGIYLLVVENASLGCADSTTVSVSKSCKPTALIAAASTTISCTQEIIALDGSGSTLNASIRYRWISPGPGCIIGDSTLTKISVKCPGTYQLIVDNLSVNEQDTALVLITSNKTFPVALIAPVDTLTCSRPTVVLNGAGSTQGTNIQYTWLNNLGQTVGRTAQINVNTSGIYALEVLDTLNGCFAQTEALVVKDTIFPEINFSSPNFPCNRDTFNIRATVLPANRNYQFRWIGAGLTGNTDTLAARVTAAGAYVFSATDLSSNCTVTDTLDVAQQVDCLPCVRATSSDINLTCNQTQLPLPVVFCRPCVGCTISWSSKDGNFLSRTDTLTPLVNRPGTYTLIVSDSSARPITLIVQVRAEQQLPILPIGFDSSLTCAIKRIALPNPDSSTLNPIVWNWETADGLLEPDTLPGHFNAARIGTYKLVARNVQTNCESFMSVRIGLDTLSPRAEAGADQILDCNNQRLTLNGNGSALGPGISYLWTALDNGRILAGENSVNPVVDAQGRYVIRVEDERNNCYNTDTLRVIPDATLPAITPILPPSLNCRDSVLTLSGNMPANGTFTAQWCAFDRTKDTIACFAQQNLRINRGGLYSYELTDTRNNCRNRIFVDVKENHLLPAIDAGARDTLSCSAINLRLSGQNLRQSDSLSFSWRGNSNQSIQEDTTLSPLIISGGWYTLKAQNRTNFCTSIDSVFVVTDLGRPQAFAGRDTFLNCVPLQISLQGNFSAPNGETLEARWTANEGRITSGQNTANPQVDQPGLYQLMVRNTVNNCVAADEVLVGDQTLKPKAEIAGPSALSCKIAQITLSGKASANPFNRTLRYFWTPVNEGRIIGSPANDSMVTARAGLYRLIVTDPLSGCQDSTDYSVQSDINLPRIGISPPATLSCSRQQVRIDAGESATGVIYRYSWTGPNGQALSDTTRTPSVSLPGIYRLTVRNLESGCVAVDSTGVQEDYVLPKIRLRALDVLDCATPNIELEAGTSQGNNLSFRWSATQPGIVSNPNEALIRVNAPGYYRLVLTDGLNGCSSSDSLLVNEAAKAIDSVLYVVRQPGCGTNLAGEVSVSSIIGGTGPYKVFLNNIVPEANDVFRNLRAGSYTLKVQDAGGCQWSAPILLQEATKPSIELGPDREIKLGDSVSVTPIISRDSIVALDWATGLTPSKPNSRTQVLKPGASTTVQVTIRAANGCTASDFLNIRVIRELPLFVPNGFSPNGDGVNDLLNVFAGPQVAKVKFFRIYDRWGTQVFGLQEFKPNEALLGWDGTIGGKLLNSAVFSWYAEVEMADGKLELLKGDVTLMR